MDRSEAAVEALRQRLDAGLGGQYRVLRLLGRGGMGAVFLARDESLERLVAIKVLPEEASGDSERRERFRTEARIAAGLSHPNIVPLHAFGEIDGSLYLVMEYVRGEALSRRLRREGTVPPDEARRILAATAEALDHAHRRGIVHRDVKPDNILIEDESGRALLADFGIAKAASAERGLTRTGHMIGTPAYMSPEQALGRPVDGRADLYSLGAVGYVMLTGAVPFEGATPEESLARRLKESPLPLRSKAPGVPRDLAEAVDRCLAPEPDRRFPDARSLRVALAPDSIAEDDLPEPLDTLDGMAPVLLPMGYVAAVTLALGLAIPPDAIPVRAAGYPLGAPLTAVAWLAAAFLGGAVLLQVPALLGAAAEAGRRGFPFREILTAFLRQPLWWACLWYPPPFRRRDDVWPRLPPGARLWRIAMTVMIADLALMPLLFLPPLMLTSEARTTFRLGLVLEGIARYIQPVFISFFFAGLALPIVLVWATRSVAGQDLDAYARRRVVRALLFGPTSNRAAWRRPDVLRALRPVAAVRPPIAVPRTPRECLAAIAEHARAAGLPGGDERLLEGSRRLAAEIEALDQELASLERAADAAELARLEERLGRMQVDASAGGGQDQELRDLVSRQLALLKEYAARLEAGRARRRALFEHLLGLWRAVEARPTGSGTTPIDVEEDLARRLAEVADILGPATEAGPTATTSTTRTAPGPAARP